VNFDWNFDCGFRSGVIVTTAFGLVVIKRNVVELCLGLGLLIMTMNYESIVNMNVNGLDYYGSLWRHMVHFVMFGFVVIKRNVVELRLCRGRGSVS